MKKKVFYINNDIIATHQKDIYVNEKTAIINILTQLTNENESYNISVYTIIIY